MLTADGWSDGIKICPLIDHYVAFTKQWQLQSDHNQQPCTKHAVCGVFHKDKPGAILYMIYCSHGNKTLAVIYGNFKCQERLSNGVHTSDCGMIRNMFGWLPQRFSRRILGIGRLILSLNIWSSQTEVPTLYFNKVTSHKCILKIYLFQPQM